MKVWLVQPWYDEGEGYEDEPGPIQPIRAETPEIAEAEYERIFGGARGLVWYKVWETTEDDARALLARRTQGIAPRPLTQQEQEFLTGEQGR